MWSIVDYWFALVQVIWRCLVFAGRPDEKVGTLIECCLS